MRRLVAALPCRANSTRLFAKPLQPLGPGVCVVEHLIGSLQAVPCVADVRLAIAHGVGDCAFVDLASRLGIGYHLGSEPDVLGRVIECARAAQATDVLRKTSEDPFLEHSALEPAWARHIERGSDVTALDDVPEGTAFEIFTLEALERCHRLGDASDREHIANYARFHQQEFRVDILGPADPDCRRLDLRLTVDNPEDLIVCRAVYQALASRGRPIPLAEIVRFLDDAPHLRALVADFVHVQPTWRDLDEAARA